MSDRPNFVFLMTDTQRADMVGCYGHADMRTPNLDALAQAGVRFTRMTAVSDEQGRVEMGGFHGTYRVCDERGRNGTFELASAAAPAPVEVQLQ